MRFIKAKKVTPPPRKLDIARVLGVFRRVRTKIQIIPSLFKGRLGWVYFISHLIKTHPYPPLKREGISVRSTVKDLTTQRLSVLTSKSTHPLTPAPQGRGRKAAFTLAEVLITLGIIGVVAGMVVPNTVSNFQEKQTVVRLNHTYSILNDAVAAIVKERYKLNYWGDDSREFFEAELTKHLRVIDKQQCNLSNRKSICPFQRSSSNIPYMVLNNGIILKVVSRNMNNNPSGYHHCYASVKDALRGSAVDIHYGSCASIQVDINGLKKPNEWGKDSFEFRVYTDGILPRGIFERKSNDGFDKCYKGMGGDLTTCTAWVINYKNMDYLKCRDKISWDGAHSCKDAKNNP